MGISDRDYIIEKKNKKDKYVEKSNFRMSYVSVKKIKRKKHVKFFLVSILLILLVCSIAVKYL